MAANPVIDIAAQERQQVCAALLEKVAASNQGALAELYDRTNGMVYGLALRVLGDESSAEEVAMEVYMQVWRTAGTYDSSRGTVSSWLVTLTRSRAIDVLRRRKTRKADKQATLDDALGVRDSRPSPEQSAAQSGTARMIQQALYDLPEDQREAIELAYYSGLSHSEIASRSGLPLGTVKTRIRLGMMRLRESLQPRVGAM